MINYRGGEAELERVVFLQFPGPEICDGVQDEQGDDVGVLEGDGERSDGYGSSEPGDRGDEENAGFLQEQSA